ncbi:MAG: LysM peptidoglycan-binding domain-containing protein [Rhodospirillales bacterium]
MNRPLIIAIAGALAVVAAIALNYSFLQEEVNDKAAQKQAAPSAKEQTQAAKPEAAGPSAPSFDVVRVNPKGDTVMAGRAEPGSTVVILDGDKVIGKVTADSRGEWVFVPDRPLPPGSRQLRLEMHRPGQPPVKSTSDVVLVVPEREKEAPALALKVPSGKSGPSTVLQKSTPHKVGDLSVDTVDYDDKGFLSIGGQAPPKTKLRVYLSNTFIGDVTADDKGKWRLNLTKPITPGLYTLRVDQLGPAGKVIARVAFPFTRSKPMGPLRPGTFVVVQPGNSLWRISRRTYGDGVQYSVIYDANKDQIKDPDLIYPGQIFSLPPSH